MLSGACGRLISSTVERTTAWRMYMYLWVYVRVNDNTTVVCILTSFPISRTGAFLETGYNHPIKALSMFPDPHSFRKLNYEYQYMCTSKLLWNPSAVDPVRAPIWNLLHSCKKLIFFRLPFSSCRGEEERSTTCLCWEVFGSKQSNHITDQDALWGKACLFL